VGDFFWALGTGDFGTTPLNASGDAAFAFLLTPFGTPPGFNAGVYRYSHQTGAVTPVVVPFVTPAPGGGTFQGASFIPALNNGGELVFAGMVRSEVGTGAGLGLGVFKEDTV